MRRFIPYLIGLMGLVLFANSAIADENFIAGVYRSTTNNTYLVTGPTSSRLGRSVWSIVSIETPSTGQNFTALWETGNAVGNTFIGMHSFVTANPSSFPGGKSYGEVGGYYNGAPLLSASQDGDLLTLELLSDGYYSFQGNPNARLTMTRIGDNNTSIAGETTQDFEPGVYTDFNGRRILVSGPTPTSDGRMLWAATSLDNDSEENIFIAAWETTYAIGNMFFAGLDYDLQMYANAYASGRAYGGLASALFTTTDISGNPATIGGPGNSKIAVIQTGKVIFIQGVNYTGTSAMLALIRSGDSDALNSSNADSTTFLPGRYIATLPGGREYILSGPTPSKDDRMQWLLTAVDPAGGRDFYAVWETGEVSGNTFVGADSYVVSQSRYLSSRFAYGMRGGEWMQFTPDFVDFPNGFTRVGGNIRVLQAGNVLIMHQLMQGTPYGGMAFIRAGDDPAAATSASSKTFQQGIYRNQDGYFAASNSGNSWSLSTQNGLTSSVIATWEPGEATAGLSLGRDQYNRQLNVIQSGNFLLVFANDPYDSTGVYSYGGDNITFGSGAGTVSFRDSVMHANKDMESIYVPVDRISGSNGTIRATWFLVDETAVLDMDHNSGNGDMIWMTGENDTQYIEIILPRNRVPSGRSFTIQLVDPVNTTINPRGTITVFLDNPEIDSATTSDRLFDWAEYSYPSLFPESQSSRFTTPLGYVYRCYSGTGFRCLATGIGEHTDSLYYFDTSSGMISLGSVEGMLTQAAAGGF